MKLGGAHAPGAPPVPTLMLCSGELSESLRILDLARNTLTVLPHKFPSFKKPVQLKLDCNELQILPRTFGKMLSLKFLGQQ